MGDGGELVPKKKNPKSVFANLFLFVQISRYREKVKELSFIYHHRETKPGKTLVHWVEHVIQTNGAPHLQSPALHVPLYQKLYLDLLALIILGLMIVKRVLKALCCSKSQNKKKGEDKKKKRS